MKSTPVRYVINPDMPLQYATNTTVQRTSDGVLLNIYQARPPANVEDAEEFHGACIARLVLPINTVRAMCFDLIAALDAARKEQTEEPAQ